MASNIRNGEKDKTYQISTSWCVGAEEFRKNEINQDAMKAVPNLPGVKYCFTLHPKLLENPHVFLFLEMPKNMSFFVDAEFSCHEAKIVHKWTHHYTESEGHCSKICSLENIFDASNKFFDRYHVFSVKATLTVLTIDDLLKKKIKIDSLGLSILIFLWQKEDSKDAKIVVSGKEIKVHKCVVQSRSTIFKSVDESVVKVEPGMSEPVSKKKKTTVPVPKISNDIVSINNYGYNIVERAVMFCYDVPCVDKISATDAVNLFKFATEYQMENLKEKAEEFCVKSLTVSNACFYANTSIKIKAEELYHKSFEFLLKCMKDGTAVKEIEKLNAEMQKELFIKAFKKP